MPQKNDLKAIQTVQHIADLAALRNQLTTVQTGTEIASIPRARARSSATAATWTG